MKTLKALHYSPDAIDPAQSTLSRGRLMAPHEVTESFALRGHEVPPELKGYWSLCGELTEAMFDEVQATSSQFALRLSAFTTMLGGTYVVLTHQMMSRQHRFVLPLWDRGVLAGVRAMHAGKLKVMLARGEEETALVFSSGFNPHEIEPLLAFEVTKSPDELLRLIAEMPTVVQTLMQLEAIPSCHWHGPITEVGVSMVAPVQAALSVLESGPVRH